MADTPAEFWTFLLEGGDAFCPVPADRWDARRFYDPDRERPGKMYVNEGAFLRAPIDSFDALAFGISPREARYIDPQQRLLLEATWEALEDAGLPQEQLRGADVGVFVGGFTLDSMNIQLAYENQHLIGSHSASGATMTMLANRLSHVFDLRGPSISIDTACSSSLTAAHYACQALWNGDCSLAIVGGVNVMLRPGFPIAMCKGGFLSPRGRCTAFDERAAGYARGEGAGIAVLAPLALAQKRRDRIYAAILATGVNQDGRTQGISLPNREAQVALLRRVLAEAGVAPAQMRYVEAHGTGTQAGDTIEATALQQVLSEGRKPGDKVWVGSVKTNIGHLEAAAGIAGLIKACLALHHRIVPANLHFVRPNPNIPFSDMCLAIPTEAKPLDGDGLAIAGVNSFGYGGANAHLVLEQVPSPRRRALPARSTRGRKLFALPISARSPEALRARARAYAAVLSAGEISLEDFAHTACHRSSHLSQRTVLLFRDRAELIARLESAGAGEARGDGVVSGDLPAQRPLTAFVFTGMGPQWWGMGRELWQTEPVYAAALAEVDDLFRQQAGWSLIEELALDQHSSRVTSTQVAQPTNFALQYALTALWRSWGIRPEAVLGHSVGEVAAACASGALSLADAVAVSFHRSRLQQAVAESLIRPGAMLAASLPESEAEELLAKFPGVEIAAVNARASITFSGDAEPMRRLARHLEEREVFCRPLQVEVAYHSHHMEPLAARLEHALAGIRASAATTAIYSSVSGVRANGKEFGPLYWARNMREPVRLRAALRDLLANGFRCFVEVGPHPVLRAALADALAEQGLQGTVLASLRRAEPELPAMLRTLGSLYTLGHQPAWKAVRPPGGAFAPLPRYPWQRTRFWNEGESSRAVVLGESQAHPLLQTRDDAPLPCWRAELNSQFLPWLDHHRIRGTVVFPGAAYLEAALAAARAVAPDGAAVVQEVEFHRPLALDSRRVTDLRLDYDPGSQRWSIAAGERGARTWTLHASGTAAVDPRGGSSSVGFDLEAAQRRLVASHISPPQLYRNLSARGLEYGPAFRTITAIAAKDREVLVRLETEDDPNGWLMHPTLLDGAFQAAVALVQAESPAPLVPARVDRIELAASPARQAWAHLERRDGEQLTVDIVIADDAGAVCARLRGVAFRSLPLEQSAVEQSAYALEWEERRRPDTAAAAPRPRVLVLGDDECDAGLVLALEGAGASCQHAHLGASLCYPSEFDHVVFTVAHRSDRESPTAELERIGFHLLRLTDQLSRGSPPPRFTLIVPLDAEQGEDLVAAALAGALAVVRSEYPGLSARAIRAAVEPPAWDAVVAEILGGNSDPDIRLLGEQRYELRLHRLERLSAPLRQAPRAVPLRDTAVTLDVEKPGVLSSLHHRLATRRCPGPREVEIRVRAAGINFKDLLKVAGQLDPLVTRETFLGEAWGMECVGEVTAVGAEVTRFAPGDGVAAIPSRGCFGSFTTTDEETVGRLPTGLSELQAASVIIPYLTAWHALINVAQLRAGESVLIHSAAGGVGFCATQVARMLGATVIATAGSEAKRAFLSHQGIERVADSRSLAFARAVLDWTEGRGVDVVLSALAGDGFLESFRVLARYGRFIDIGKKAIVDNQALPLRVFNEGLTYAAIDMDRMLRDRTSFCVDIVLQALDALAAGKLAPPPLRVFPAADCVEAFRTMAQGQHIGRLVLDYGAAELEVRAQGKSDVPLFRRDGCYVVTGGLSGFGLELARFLVERGAGALILLGRRGLTTPGAAAAVAELEAAGTRVQVAAVDVADRAALHEALACARQKLGPLRGVFHCAMVLHDGWIAQISRASMAEVLAPKAGGAWHLHQLTSADPLDHFVLFSSVAVVVGNPGQACYVTANAFLDALAEQRQRAGKSGLSVQLGVLGEVGVVARQEQIADALAAAGMVALSTADALHGLEQALRSGRARVGLFEVDWARFANHSPEVVRQPRFTRVRLGGLGLGTAVAELLTELMRIEPEQWVTRIAEKVRGEVAALIGVEANKVAVSQSLIQLGVDSLLAVELANALAARGLPITVVELMRGPSVAELAEKLTEGARRLISEHCDELRAAFEGGVPATAEPGQEEAA
jgi:acyl transferase domain-containing protein/NADPH:quinone reductase-like Zn-dependent oxidoreductase/NAD(P)-dependent dehydrogenase (short-subunit alcohol dehydrogenase family)/aryl carrier-like protein